MRDRGQRERNRGVDNTKSHGPKKPTENMYRDNKNGYLQKIRNMNGVECTRE